MNISTPFAGIPTLKNCSVKHWEHRGRFQCPPCSPSVINKNHLDNFPKILIIENEEQRLCGCSSCIGYVVAITRSQKLPSLLAQVAVVFFAAILLMGFLDDDCHRVLPHMKGYAHRPSPLSESRSSRQACVTLHPAPCGARLLYMTDTVLSRTGNGLFFCAPVCQLAHVRRSAAGLRYRFSLLFRGQGKENQP